ncbi:hypothetical protein [uncultured Mediterranean phage uvMED]|nr:hypothetical protein [uncultured Mediterranean phage uvMED]
MDKHKESPPVEKSSTHDIHNTNESLNGMDSQLRNSPGKTERLNEMQLENLLIKMVQWWRGKALSQTAMIEKIKEYTKQEFGVERSNSQARRDIKRLNTFIRKNYSDEVKEDVYKLIEMLYSRLEDAIKRSEDETLADYLRTTHAQRADKISLELIKIHPDMKTQEETKPTEIQVTFIEKESDT